MAIGQYSPAGHARQLLTEVPPGLGLYAPALQLVGSMAFALLSAEDVASAPFTLGFVFKEGDVRAGNAVTAAAVTGLQVVPKNRWPDGSQAGQQVLQPLEQEQATAKAESGTRLYR